VNVSGVQHVEDQGNIWLDFRGHYLGNHRSDDLDEMEVCDECGGSGTSEMCAECMDIEMEL